MRWAAGLVLMVAVIALAVTFVNQVWVVVHPVAFAPAQKPTLPETGSENKWVEIGGIDPSRASDLERVLRSHGIQAITEGSVVYSVYVHPKDASRSQQIIAEDASLKSVYIARNELSPLPKSDWRNWQKN